MTVGALTGSRVLSKLIPQYGEEGRGAFIDTTDGWTPLNGWKTGTTTRGLRCLMYETYFDLQGYQLDDLTLYPAMALLQDPGAYTSNDTNTPIMEVLDIISQDRLDIDTLADLIVQNNVPGMTLSQNEWTNITFGQYRLMMNSAEFNETGTKTWLTSKRNDFGSGMPVTATKLWCYRFVRFLVNDGKLLMIPASRFILAANIEKDSELVYLQRLRRNYELQGALN
tara:strand:+ start:23 stop:697 length:675 start_codon:yes stop_codon:yes gene_type:complete